MLNLRLCPCCNKIKFSDRFSEVITNEDFIYEIDKSNNLASYRLHKFTQLVCNDCISQIQLENED